MSKKSKALRFNTGKPKWGLIDFKSLEPLIRVLEYGAHKYSLYLKNGKKVYGKDIPFKDRGKYKLLKSGNDNWKAGLNRTEVLESAMRHLAAIMDGEKYDNESGIDHMGHVMCNALFHIYFESNGKY